MSVRPPAREHLTGCCEVHVLGHQVALERVAVRRGTAVGLGASSGHAPRPSAGAAGASRPCRDATRWCGGRAPATSWGRGDLLLPVGGCGSVPRTRLALVSSCWVFGSGPAVAASLLSPVQGVGMASLRLGAPPSGHLGARRETTARTACLQLEAPRPPASLSIRSRPDSGCPGRCGGRPSHSQLRCRTSTWNRSCAWWALRRGDLGGVGRFVDQGVAAGRALPPAGHVAWWGIQEVMRVPA